MMPGVIVLLADTRHMGGRLFFGLHMDRLAEKAGFFLFIFTFSGLSDRQILGSHLPSSSFSAFDPPAA
jgi:hypothetical protein